MWSRHDRGVRGKEATGTELKTILVPVDGSTASGKAVEFAVNLAKRSRGKVHVVHVIEVRRSLPLDAELVSEALEGESILDQAEQIAKRLDSDVEGDLLQAREAGHAIIDEAVERRADVIVVGVPYRKPFGEFELGRVPAHILKAATCEVILLRMPAIEA
jgi:nucleotide-binding universal stress UspA family protein